MAVSAVAGLTAVAGTAGAAYSIGGAVWAAYGLQAAATAFAIGAGLSAVNRALMPKPSFGVGMEGLQTTVKNAAESRKIVYGEMRTGGNIVYMNTSGEDNKYLHLVIAYAAHEIESYEKVFFNEQVVWSNNSYLDNWNQHATIYFHKGDQTTADAELDQTFVTWTADHKLLDIAYLHVRLEWDADKYQNGIPNITAQIKGKKVLDPRSGLTAWSDNPALCLYDYMRDAKYGMGEPSANFDLQSVIDAANLCDETDAQFTGKRYGLNGVVDTSNKIKDNIEAMTSAMAGHVSFSGGKFFVYGGSFRTAIATTFDETHLVGDIQLATKQSRRSLFNAVKGVFVSAQDDYIATDYPAQISGAYSVEDGEPIYLDMPLPFTTSQDRAQRLAKIALLRSRQQRVITMPMNMAALQFKAGDVIKVSNDKLGFTDKLFEVISYDVRIGDQIIVDVQAIETDAGLYDWTTSDEQPYVFKGEVPVYDGTPVPPTGLSLNTGTILQADGKHIVYIDCTWVASLDAFVDFYRFKYTVNGNVTSVDTRDTSHRIIATNGDTYTIEVTAINLLGRESTILTDSVVAAQDNIAPTNPDQFTLTGGFRSVLVEWDWTTPVESDFAYLQIAVRSNTVTLPAGNPLEATGLLKKNSSTGTERSVTGLPTDTTVYVYARAVDLTGNRQDWFYLGSAITTAVEQEDVSDAVNDAISGGHHIETSYDAGSGTVTVKVNSPWLDASRTDLGWSIDYSGATDSTSAMAAMWAYATANGYSRVYLGDKGTIKILSGNNAVPAGIEEIWGGGMEALTIYVEDTTVGAAGRYNGLTFGVGGNPKTPHNISVFIHDFGIKGAADVKTSDSFGINGTNGGTGAFRAQRIKIEAMTNQGFSLTNWIDVNISECKLINNGRGGIGLRDCKYANINNNYIKGNGDDSIFFSQTNDVSGQEYQTIGATIHNNIIVNGQGIRVLSPRFVDISNNVIIRPKNFGIFLGASGDANEGVAAAVGSQIKDNIIADCIYRQYADFFNNSNNYIVIESDVIDKNLDGKLPYDYDAVTTELEKPYEAFHESDTINQSTLDHIGVWWITIEGNTLVSTLGHGTNWASQGFEKLWYTIDQQSAYEQDFAFDTNADKIGDTDVIDDIYLACDGIKFKGAVTGVHIKGNRFLLPRLSMGINFTDLAGTGPIADFSLIDVLIEGNEFFRFPEDNAINFVTTGTTTQLVTIKDNLFVGDPFLESTVRSGNNGAWQDTNTKCIAIDNGGLTKLIITGNTFKEVCKPLFAHYQGDVLKDNIIVADFAAHDYSASNKGVGNIPDDYIGFTIVDYSGDPQTAVYRRINAMMTGALQAITSSYMQISGRIGIGTAPDANADLHILSTNPIIKLEDSDATNSPYSIISGSGGNLILQADDGNESAGSYIAFQVDTDEKARITDAGTLEISGGQLSVKDSTDAVITEVISAATYGVVGTDTDHELRLRTNNASRLTLRSTHNTFSNNVSIGSDTVNDGKLHIWSGTAGAVTAGTDANELVLENSGDVGMSFLSPSTTFGRIKFGDENNSNAGVISYSHVTDTFAFNTATSKRLEINADGLDVTGNLVLSGDLTVNGTTTTLNAATLDVEDKNITLNYGTGNTSASADGAGITIQDAVNETTDATLLWDATNDRWTFSHATDVKGVFRVGDDLADDFAALYVSGTVSTLLLGNESGAGGKFAIEYNRSSGETFFRRGSAQLKAVEVGNGGDFIWFKDDGATEGMRFDSSFGGLAIGRTSAQQALHVAGNARIDSTYPTLFLRDTDAGTTGSVQGAIIWEDSSGADSQTISGTAGNLTVNVGTGKNVYTAVNGVNVLDVAGTGATVTGNLTVTGSISGTFAETDTLDTVTSRGSTTTNNISVNTLDVAGELNMTAETANYFDFQGTSWNLRSFQTPSTYETCIQANENSSVILYHNGAAKLATTATGVDVTGGIDVSGIASLGTVHYGEYQEVFTHSFKETLTKVAGAGTSEQHLLYVGRVRVGINEISIASAGSYGENASTFVVNVGYTSPITQTGNLKHESTWISRKEQVSGHAELKSWHSIYVDVTTADLFIIYEFEASQPAGAHTITFRVDGTYSDSKTFSRPAHGKVLADLVTANEVGLMVAASDFAVGGYLGIGELNPVNPIHIADTAPTIRLEDTDATGNAYAVISGANGNIILQADKGQDSAGSSIQFEIDSSEKMRLSDAGFLGINTTSPVEALHVNGEIYQLNNSFLGHGLYFDNSSWRYGGTNHGAMLKLSDNNGDLVVTRTTATGSAGGAASVSTLLHWDRSADSFDFYSDVMRLLGTDPTFRVQETDVSNSRISFTQNAGLSYIVSQGGDATYGTTIVQSTNGTVTNEVFRWDENNIQFKSASVLRYRILSNGDSVWYDDAAVEAMRWDASAKSLNIDSDGQIMNLGADDLNGNSNISFNGSRAKLGYANGALTLQQGSSKNIDFRAYDATFGAGALIHRMTSTGDCYWYNNSGTASMRWDRTNSRLGVGAASPSHNLQVNHNTTGEAFISLYNTAGTHSSIILDSGAASGTYLRFSQDGVNKYWINVDTSGNMLYRPNASGVYHVAMLNGYTTEFQDSTGAGRVKIDPNATYSFVGTSTDHELRLGTNSAVRLTLDSTKAEFTVPINVGTLDVDLIQGTKIVNTFTNSQPFYISRNTLSAESVAIGVDDGYAIFESIQDEQYGGFDFKSKHGANPTYTRFLISTTGNLAWYDNVGIESARWDATNKRLGIGETAPSTDLHITSTSPTIRLEDSDNSRYAHVSGSNGNIILQADKGVSGSDSSIQFEINNIERMRLSNGGGLNLRGGFRSETDEGSIFHWGYPDSLNDANTTAWKKVADVTITSGLFGALSCYITMYSQDGNYGATSHVSVDHYIAHFHRSGGVLNNPSDAELVGSANSTWHELRILKVSDGVYELQCRATKTYASAEIEIKVISTNGGKFSVPDSIVLGSTTGTAYTPVDNTLSVVSLPNTISRKFTSVDPTKTCKVEMQAEATYGIIGTDTNHELRIRTNSAARLNLDSTKAEFTVSTMYLGNTDDVNVAKYPRFFSQHYNGVNPVTMLGMNNDASNNWLLVGGGSSGTLDHYAATLISFYTANNITTESGSERLRIGCSATESHFDFKEGNFNQRIFLRDSDDNIGWYSNTHGRTWFRYKDNATAANTVLALQELGGNVGIGTSAPGTALDVVGTVRGDTVRGDSVLAGVNDTTSGVVKIYGGGTGTAEGGQLEIYPAADHDTNFDFWYIDAYQDDLRIVNGGNVCATFIGNTTNTVFGGNVQASTFTGTGTGSRFNALSVGADDDVYLYASTANELGIRTGTTGAYRYWQFKDTGDLNCSSGGITFFDGDPLDKYDEGTWTPTNAGDATGVLGTVSGTYTRVGRIVTLHCYFTVSTNFTGNQISGLPFSVRDGLGATTLDYQGVVMNGSNTIIGATALGGTNNIGLRLNFHGGTGFNPNTTDGGYRITIQYETNA